MNGKECMPIKDPPGKKQPFKTACFKLYIVKIKYFHFDIMNLGITML